jgi:oligoendopeptidase F
LPTTFPPPPRRFLPAALDLGAVADLDPRFDDLLHRPLATVADLEGWLLDESELMSAIAGELARRYVRMTRSTDDATAKQAYLAMEQQVMPHVKVRSNELDRRFLATPLLHELDAARYETTIRRRRTQAEIFRPENTELQRQESELQTRQQEIMGGITVVFDGATRTLQQLAPYLERQERDVRESAWRASLQARQQHWPALEDLFDQLVALRTQMGRNAGHPTYTPFRFLELGRYDYDAASCRRLHDAIAECVVPAVKELDRRRAQRLGLPRLRPWDLEVDPEGRPPLRPFADEASLIALTRRILVAVAPMHGEWIDELSRRGLLDLMSRKGKAPGGYQYQLEDERVPFIFANAVGVHHDVQTLLHECGHAFHSLRCRELPLMSQRDYAIEIAETASMSMELMGLEHLGAVYAPDDVARVRRKHLEGVLRTLTWIASIDAIQHWIYANPTHKREERRAAWLDIRRRFGSDVDWSGLGDALAMQWIGQGHLFQHAFYYVEYAIAQLAALQVWARYRREPAKALADHGKGLALGGSRPLPELFAAMGVRFDLGPDALQPLVDDVMREIGQ